MAPLRLSTSTFQPSGLLLTRHGAPDTHSFHSLVVDPSVTQIHPALGPSGEKVHLPFPKLLFCSKDVTFMPKPQGSPSADFRSFLVGRSYPCLVGVNSPVSPSWVFPVLHPPAPTVLPPLPWHTPRQPLPVRASRAAAEAKMSSSPPDFQLSLKRAARPASVWAVVLHLSYGLCFSGLFPCPHLPGRHVLSPCSLHLLAPSLPSWGLGPPRREGMFLVVSFGGPSGEVITLH